MSRIKIKIPFLFSFYTTDCGVPHRDHLSIAGVVGSVSLAAVHHRVNRREGIIRIYGHIITNIYKMNVGSESEKFKFYRRSKMILAWNRYIKWGLSYINWRYFFKDFHFYTHKFRMKYNSRKPYWRVSFDDNALFTLDHFYTEVLWVL